MAVGNYTSKNTINPTKRKCQILKASGETKVMSLAKSIVIEVKKKGIVEIEYMGGKAGNITTKAIAVARAEVLSKGIDLWSYPVFREITFSGKQRDGNNEKTGITMIVEDKSIN